MARYASKAPTDETDDTQRQLTEEVTTDPAITDVRPESTTPATASPTGKADKVAMALEAAFWEAWSRIQEYPLFQIV